MKKRTFQIIASVIVVLTLLSSFCLTSFAESISINGTGSGNAGGNANTSTSGTGYSVQSVSNFAGYRFTYTTSSGSAYKNGTVDIINSSQWSDYTGRKTTSAKYNKKDLIDLYKSEADFTMDIITSSSSTATKDSGSYGLSYVIDTASSDMAKWKDDDDYVEKVLQLMSSSYTIANMKTTDQILVEPIVLCQVGGERFERT